MNVKVLDTAVLAAVAPLRAAGFALHWLHPREKRPIGDDWSERPVLSIEQLRATHRAGNNLGVRLGEPSIVADGYLHVLDMDIRVPDLKDEAWEALAELFPNLNIADLPCVQSGSGAESRHLYLITDKPFRSKKLRTSEGKHRHFDKKKGRDVWSYDWEIELFGTSKQVVVPPSIHPESGKPYLWLREFDFAVLDLGIGPFMPSAAIERLAVAEHATYEFETREPLTFGPGQLDRLLADIPAERIDDYHDWITIGQALHHQFGGSDAGFELWLTHSARSPKFDPKDRRNLLRKWRGFGKNRRKPVTLATVVEWANRRRNAAKGTPQLEGRIWHVTDTLNGELWSDDRDFDIRAILEAPGTQGGYGIKVTDRDLKAAIVLSANGSAFHPVREYLESQAWDGTPRVENLFRDYVGAPDDAYSRSVSRLMMVAAVTRIFEPGHKFDFAVILEGLQGKRKSTFIQTLGKSWFAELDGDFHDPKQMIELMQGAWIMEIPELSGFNRGDVRSIKAFISRQKDRARLAYARRAGSFPRQCIFIGSTNDKEYLKDDTGGRRFWPMLCTAAEIDIAGLEANVDQLWAEALVLYKAMRAAHRNSVLASRATQSAGPSAYPQRKSLPTNCPLKGACFVLTDFH